MRNIKETINPIQQAFDNKTRNITQQEGVQTTTSSTQIIA
jgi:hypothetical protein